MTMDRSTMELVYEYHEQLLAATAPASPLEKEIPPTKRRVQFAATGATVSDIPSPLVQFGDDDWYSCDSPIYQTIWYTPSELQAQKSEARDILFRKGQPGSEMDELRGLERYDYERSRLKKLTNRHILAAFQESMGNSPFLSLVCQRCTMWSRNLAIDQGKRDQITAYYGESTAPSTPATPSCQSKRTIVDPEQGRRVRQRVMSCQG